MKPGPVARAVRGGITRRRLQTIVLCLVVLVSTSASVLALALVVDSAAPFDHAFAAQHGADLTLITSGASAAQLTATKNLGGVTGAAGPFPETTITPRVQICGPIVPGKGGPKPLHGPGQGSAPAGAAGPAGQCFGMQTLPAISVVGRASPGGTLDKLVLQSGHWATRPGQIVLAANQAVGNTIQLPLGNHVIAASAPGKPRLTIVGYADSVTDTADGWVVPGEITRLSPAHGAGGGTTAAGATAAGTGEQMLYRFTNAGTRSALRTDVRALTAALPSGSVTGTQTYLAIKVAETGDIAPFVPFLVAFGLIGIVMSVLIVVNVVSGAVVAGFRRIGVLKSIGFTPGQVVAAYTGQVTVPAAAGCLGGLVAGNLLAIPVLAQTANAYGIGALRVPVWVDVAVPVAMCCLTGLAAVGSALRAGRLSAVQAIAMGRAPRTGRGFAAHRLLGRLPLPRPVTIGLAGPFARPARTMLTMAAVLLGAIAVTFAVGLDASLNQVVAGLSHDSTEPVTVLIPGQLGSLVHFNVKHGAGPATKAGRQPSAAQMNRTVTAALRAQPGTARYVAEASLQVSVSGLTSQVQLTAFRGNSAWTGYDLIGGHWYSGPGQVDVPTRFLTVTGKQVGDMITLGLPAGQVRARIVGQVFDTSNNGLVVFTNWRTVAGAIPGFAPYRYDVALRPGVSSAAYVSELGKTLGTRYLVTVNNRSSELIGLMIGLTGTLTLLLAIVAGLGVLNTVVLSTRERVSDLGIFKAIGMSPRQTIAMVLCWVAGTGLVAGLLAVPAGVVLHQYVLPAMAAGAGLILPAKVLAVYGGWELAGLGLAGVAIAVAGALLPAGWAASIRTATALHAE